MLLSRIEPKRHTTQTQLVVRKLQPDRSKTAYNIRLFLARKALKLCAFHLFSGEEISSVVIYGFSRNLTCMLEVGHDFFFL